MEAGAPHVAPRVVDVFFLLRLGGETPGVEVGKGDEKVEIFLFFVCWNVCKTLQCRCLFFETTVEWDRNLRILV